MPARVRDWRGFASPLRHTDAMATCASGGHDIWWVVDAGDAAAALAQLPPYVAARTVAVPVSRVAIP